MDAVRYAEVAVNIPVNKTFHYHIPGALAESLAIGHLVRVDMRTAAEPGVVVGLHDESPVASTKPVIETLDPEPVVSPGQIDLARWISARYLAPIGQCLWLMLPPGIVGQRDQRVTLVDENAAPDDPLQEKVVALLARRGTLTGQQIQRSVKDKKWRQALAKLADASIISTESILAPPASNPGASMPPRWRSTRTRFRGSSDALANKIARPICSMSSPV